MHLGRHVQFWVVASIFAVVIVASLPLYSYRWHLALHILGAIIFVGNIVVTGGWMILAERTRETSVIYFASRTVNRADVLFTGPGVILVLLNGLALAESRWGGWTRFYENSWIAMALILFGLSGIVWVSFLLRYQYRLVRLSAHAVKAGDQLPAEFDRVLHKWYIWGSIATILPLVSLYLMVVKPTFW